MISVLNIIGICEGDIEHAYDVVQDALKALKINVDVTDDLQDRLIEYFDISDPTNCIISAMFDIAENFVYAYYDELDVRTYVNGYDSHFNFDYEDFFNEIKDFSISGDEINKIISLMNDGLSEETAVKIAENFSLYEKLEDELDFEEIEEVFSNDDLIDNLSEVYGDVYIYDSLEDLGKDFEDSSLREDNASDEEFGQFLIDNYNNNYSGKEVCYLFNGTERILYMS